MASSLSNDDDIIAGINITPLVDVVLVLLIIFMITAPMLYQASLKVQLPQTKSGDSTEKSSFSFMITKSGEVSWDDKPIDWQTLQDKLASLNNDAKQKSAVISADRETPHGTVIRLIDSLRQGGINHFALNVQTTAAPK